MKVLIVDDEKHVRSSIRLLAEWKSLGISEIFEAENGMQAIEIILNEKPQLVITDIMMPIKNGIELMEWMEKNVPHCKKIVISGHNDFDFVRHTVKYGGIDYLLKPIDRKQLNLTIQKAVELWSNKNLEQLQHQERNMEVNVIKPFYRDKLLSGLLGQSMGIPSVNEPLFRELPQLKQAESFRVAVINFDLLAGNLLKKFASHMELLLFSFVNICNEFLEAEKKGIAFHNGNSRFEIVMFIWKDLEHAEDLMKEINEGILRTFKSKCDISISIEVNSLEKLNEAYQQARRTLNLRNLLEHTPSIHPYRAELANRKNTLYFSEFEEKIRFAIKSRKNEQITAAVQRWFDLLHTLDKITIEQLAHWWNEFNRIKAHWIEEFSQGSETFQRLMEPAPFKIPLNGEGCFSLIFMQNDMLQSLFDLSDQLHSSLANNHNVMQEIARYIELNYNQDITLQDISNIFFLNREHISRKFKQEFNENLVDFHSRMRIEKAKLILMNPNVKIAEVAQMVGYQDDKYFSRVFKKLENQTPKEYRKLVSPTD